MIPSLRPLATPGTAEAVDRLLRAVRRLLRDGGTAAGVVRIEEKVEPADLMAWLDAQPHAAKLYWHGRGEEAATASVGVADEVTGEPERVFSALESCRAALPPQARYFGGTRFEPGREAAAEWVRFGSARFVLPLVERTSHGDHDVLAVNLVLPRDARRIDAVASEIERLRPAAGSPATELPLPIARADAPGREAWNRGVERALEAFRETTLDKVVLARRARYAFDEPLSPFALARALERATPSCFHFIVQPAPGVAFLGASPERLFRHDGRRLQSEAVAGTRPRGASDAADARLRSELQESDKDQREHRFVRDQICQVLTPLCKRIAIDTEASDLTLARGRHLYSGIDATLHARVGADDLFRALHPTPAVGGTPTAEARAMIDAVEPFDRGWYAGPVGWIGADAADFAVAIRSGLVERAAEGAALSLYSGAGIVRGSEAGAEWAEIEHKISDFARVLALDA